MTMTILIERPNPQYAALLQEQLAGGLYIPCISEGTYVFAKAPSIYQLYPFIVVYLYVYICDYLKRTTT
jgi:hypothetical protein